MQGAGGEKSLASSGTGPWPASLGLAWIVTNSFGGGKCSSLKLVAQSGLASASGRLGASHMVLDLATLDILTEKKERGASHMVRNLAILDMGRKLDKPRIDGKEGEVGPKL